MGDSTQHPCQGNVLHTWPYLFLLQDENATGVEVACHSTQVRDTLKHGSRKAGNSLRPLLGSACALGVANSCPEAQQS